MAIGWTFILLGIVTARHAKRWDPLWFQVHRWEGRQAARQRESGTRGGTSRGEPPRRAARHCAQQTAPLTPRGRWLRRAGCTVEPVQCDCFPACRAVQVLGLACALSAFIIIFVWVDTWVCNPGRQLGCLLVPSCLSYLPFHAQS